MEGVLTRADTLGEFLALTKKHGRISDNEHKLALSLAAGELARSHNTILSEPATNAYEDAHTPQLEAVSTVLHTPELLENILSHLPFYDLLLRTPSICRKFKNAIETSPKLRRKMFRRADFASSHESSPTIKHVEYFRYPSGQLDFISFDRIAHLQGCPLLPFVFLAQPPLPPEDVWIVIECTEENCPWRDDDAVVDVEDEQGLTFGQVLTAIEECVKDVGPCANFSPGHTFAARVNVRDEFS